MDMTKFMAFATCELNNAKCNPADTRIYKIRCQAMFELAVCITGDKSLMDTYETVFRPVFEAYENAYLKGVSPDENN